VKMKPPTVTVHYERQEGRRRGGRPPISTTGQSASVYVTLDPDDYDRAYAVASRDRVSMPEVLRRALRKFLEAGGR